jgi:hypothetical protein
MIRMALAWAKPCGDDDDPYASLALSWSTVDGVDTGEWPGPEAHDCVTYSHHAKVHATLAGIGPRFGTNDGDGECTRGNFLGFPALNGQMWAETPWKAIGLACPQEAHGWIRPLLTKLTGPGGRWSGQWLSEQARTFFDGRREVAVNGDLRVWTTRVLHEVMLGLELSEREGAAFMALQFRIMVRMAAPKGAVEEGGPLRAALDIEELQRAKRALLDRCRPRLAHRNLIFIRPPPPLPTTHPPPPQPPSLTPHAGTVRWWRSGCPPRRPRSPPIR